MITTAYAGEIDGTRTYAKFRWKYKKAISSWNFKPYIYEEIRYNFIPDYVDRYRIAIGVESRPIKRTTFDFKIYNDQRRREKTWKSLNVCEFGIIFDF